MLVLSSRDTKEINDKTNKKVNNTNNNTEKNYTNTKNENKHDNKHKIRNAINNDNNNKQSNELNINGTIEERLMKLESEFKNLVETSKIKKDGLRKPSYANIAAIDINNFSII